MTLEYDTLGDYMYFTYDDITIYYEKYGTKEKSIIILPGWGNTRITFNTMISFLQNYFTVYILDYPGFNNSPFPNKDLTMYDYALLIYEWIKSLNIKNPILIGHSFGGRIITLLTGYYKYSFNNIIYLNSAGIKPKTKFKTRIYKIIKKLRFLLPNTYKKKYLNFLFKHFASTDYKDLNKNMQNTFKNIINLDLKHYLKNIKAKTLIIWGNKDNATPLKDAYIMNKLIKKSELIVLDKGTHFSYLDYPVLINKIIFEQLKDEII